MVENGFAVSAGDLPVVLENLVLARIRESVERSDSALALAWAQLLQMLKAS